MHTKHTPVTFQVNYQGTQLFIVLLTKMFLTAYIINFIFIQKVINENQASTNCNKNSQNSAKIASIFLHIYLNQQRCSVLYSRYLNFKITQEMLWQ